MGRAPSRRRPAAIEWSVCPNIPEIALDDVPALLREMVAEGMLVLYPAGRGLVYQVVHCWRCQNLQWAAASAYPPPAGWTDRLRIQHGQHDHETRDWDTPGGFVEGIPDALVDIPDALVDIPEAYLEMPESLSATPGTSVRPAGAAAGKPDVADRLPGAGDKEPVAVDLPHIPVNVPDVAVDTPATPVDAPDVTVDTPGVDDALVVGAHPPVPSGAGAASPTGGAPSAPPGDAPPPPPGRHRHVIRRTRSQTATLPWSTMSRAPAERCPTTPSLSASRRRSASTRPRWPARTRCWTPGSWPATTGATLRGCSTGLRTACPLRPAPMTVHAPYGRDSVPAPCTTSSIVYRPSSAPTDHEIRSWSRAKERITEAPMPRNPNKTRCTVPNCRNWAMRGHTRCRVHRNAQLGAAGGAPARNLNALKTGRHAHPLSGDDLSATGDALLARPGDLPERMAHLTRLILSRTDDPLLTLVALRAALCRLVEACAARASERELDAALDALPSSVRLLYRAQIDALAGLHDPEQRLWMLRRALRGREDRSR